MLCWPYGVVAGEDWLLVLVVWALPEALPSVPAGVVEEVVVWFMSVVNPVGSELVLGGVGLGDVPGYGSVTFVPVVGWVTSGDWVPLA